MGLGFGVGTVFGATEGFPGSGAGVMMGCGVGIPLGNGVGFTKSQYGFWQHGLAVSCNRTQWLSRFGYLVHLKWNE